MTLAAAEALNPNKPMNQTLFLLCNLQYCNKIKLNVKFERVTWIPFTLKYNSGS